MDKLGLPEGTWFRDEYGTLAPTAATIRARAAAIRDSWGEDEADRRSAYPRIPADVIRAPDIMRHQHGIRQGIDQSLSENT